MARQQQRQSPRQRRILTRERSQRRGLIPAAFQAIIAKESCIAWLPKISDATTINHLKLGDRSKSNTLAY
jgi:hypothetical protein